MLERRTKIVATIGPSSQDETTITRLLKAGVNVARLNFSHGTHDQHVGVIRLLRRTAYDLKLPLAILQDLQGPKIRTGELTHGTAELVPGNKLTLTTLPAPGDASRVSVDFSDLPRAVLPGNRILLDDGNLELRVDAIDGEEVITTVIVGGTLKPHKGVNLPGAALEIPGFTQKDHDDLVFGLDQEVDIIAISFVCSAKDIHTVKSAIQQHCGKTNVPVIAKLERPEALENLDEIVHAADGVMVARGDLGVEMSPEVVPIAQKEIIACANRHAKVVITATQMLDSMIHNPRPTRAEASDVANAIFDGTDAVMLSGETASGSYPVQAVETMNKIICQAESRMSEWGHWRGDANLIAEPDDTYFLTRAARELANDRNVAAIAVFTKSGRTARLMSKVRPGVPILAFTTDHAACQRMGLYWGVYPQVVPHVHTIEEMLHEVEGAMVSSFEIKSGQQVVLICGFPVHAVRQTNLALLHTVGER